MPCKEVIFICLVSEKLIIFFCESCFGKTSFHESLVQLVIINFRLRILIGNRNLPAIINLKS
jgi:hypothetical protein